VGSIRLTGARALSATQGSVPVFLGVTKHDHDAFNPRESVWLPCASVPTRRLTKTRRGNRICEEGYVAKEAHMPRVMAYAFGFGDRIIPSKEGLRIFRRWAGRQGTIVAATEDQDIWRVKWDGRVTIDLIHADFITRLASDELPPMARRRAS
jgi:hypothetical protein